MARPGGLARVGRIGRLERQPQTDLGAFVEAAHPRAAAVALHAAQDRLAHPEPVGRDVVEVEAVTVVAHEGLGDAAADLDVGGDGRPRVPHRVGQRFAQRAHERLARVVQCGVAGDDELDGHAVAVLDLVRGGRDGLGERTGRGGPAVQPRAQLALLGPGQAGGDGRVVGALDEREGLQHRIVQVGRDVGALGLADAGGLLALVAPPEARDPRREHEADAGKHRDGRDADVPGHRQALVAGDEDDESAAGERGPGQHARQRASPAAGPEPRLPLEGLDVAPRDDRPERDGHDRQQGSEHVRQDRVPGHPERAEGHERDPHEQQLHGQSAHALALTGPPLLGREDPQGQVGDQPQPEGEVGDHEEHPHDPHVPAGLVREPGRHAGDHRPVPPPRQAPPPRRRRGHRRLGHRRPGLRRSGLRRLGLRRPGLRRPRLGRSGLRRGAGRRGAARHRTRHGLLHRPSPPSCSTRLSGHRVHRQTATSLAASHAASHVAAWGGRRVAADRLPRPW